MSVLDKFRKGAQKAGIQATAFMQAGSTKVASGSREFVQTFSLPGEAEKAAKILDSFLGNNLSCLVISSFTYEFNLFAQRILSVQSQRLILSPKLFYNELVVYTFVIILHVTNLMRSISRLGNLSSSKSRFRFLRQSRVGACHLSSR